jgi:hypothetical protein
MKVCIWYNLKLHVLLTPELTTLMQPVTSIVLSDLLSEFKLILVTFKASRPIILGALASRQFRTT